jgi:HK97 family phage prohead protease
MKLFAKITKIDEAQHMVFGYASTEALDSQGEVVKREALEAALPDYMRFANIREMHQPSAVGVATEAELDDKGLFLAAKIVDPTAWEKVSSGVYKGFSIGGQVVNRDKARKHVITGVKLSEISLVDRPANPEAVFTMFKADEPKLAKVGARNSAADLATIQAIHDQAVQLGASCDGCALDGDDQDEDGDGGGLADKIAGPTAERDALRKALARMPAERKAALRAVPIEKSADRLGDVGVEAATNDPVELLKRSLRQPMSLGQIEKLANG